MKKYLVISCLFSAAILVSSCREDIQAYSLCIPCGGDCCDDGRICFEQMCMIPNCSPDSRCTAHSECPDQQLCVAGCCEAPAIEPPCVTDAECDADLICHGGECIAMPDIALTCQYKCLRDIECLPAEICNDAHECVPRPDLLCMGFDDSAHEQCRDAYLLNYEMDTDRDGITDGQECHASYISSNIYTPHSDPCRADSDGDTIIDGTEDINGNGKFEPYNGETNPLEADAIQFSDAVIRARKLASAMRQTRYIPLSGMSVSFTPDDSDTKSKLYRAYLATGGDSSEGILTDIGLLDIPQFGVLAGFLFRCDRNLRQYCFDRFNNIDNFMNPDAIFDDDEGKQIVKSHLYVGELNNEMPTERWENGVFEPDAFMAVSKQSASALVYHAELQEGRTLDDYRKYYLRKTASADMQFDLFEYPDNQLKPIPNTETTCPNNSIVINLIQTAFDLDTKYYPTPGKGYAYTLTVACQEPTVGADYPGSIAMENLYLSTDIIPFAELSAQSTYSRAPKDRIIQSGKLQDYTWGDAYRIPLRGMPIASSIRVSVSGCAFHGDLTRNVTVNGWHYDVEDNAIVLDEVTPDADAGVAVTYYVWEKDIKAR